MSWPYNTVIRRWCWQPLEGNLSPLGVTYRWSYLGKINRLFTLILTHRFMFTRANLDKFNCSSIHHAAVVVVVVRTSFHNLQKWLFLWTVDTYLRICDNLLHAESYTRTILFSSGNLFVNLGCICHLKSGKCAQAREILCNFYIGQGLIVPCPVGILEV